MPIRFGILGPLEVRDDGQPLTLGKPQPRALLAVLLVHANQVVSADRLIDHLWGDQPPTTARGLLHGCVAQLRRHLHTDNEPHWRPLLTRPPGYLLQVHPGELDADQFEELAATADRTAAQNSTQALEQAAALLSEALSLWRGPALDDIPLDVCRAEAARLEERRLVILEQHIEIELRLGRYASLVADLHTHVRAHPLREQLWAQLMLALHGTGRQAEALAAYQQVRQILVTQLGVEPGTTLQQLQHAILTGADPTRRVQPATPAPTAETTSRTVPAQLPAAIVAFTGRDQHLSHLDQWSAEAREQSPGAVPITVISGTAGVGKTSLALHWAHRMADSFDDGQLYVNLRGFDPGGSTMAPAEAVRGFLDALGVPPQRIPAGLDA